MPNFSGVWNLKEQIQAIAAGRWTGFPALYGWGLNSSGQVGDETTVSRSSPVQVGALKAWYQVSTGNLHEAAIAVDGTLWTWGDNGAGRLGLNNDQNIDFSSPTQVGALTDWSQVSAGSSFTAAVKTNNTLWSWGSGAFGRTGDGTTTARSSPVQIGALTNWAQVASCNQHSLAVKTDGTFWAWGSNITGRLGNNSTVSRSSPVQVGALTNWASAAYGPDAQHSAGIKTDGTLWTWGPGLSGALGDGTVTNRSSPVQVGALTNWAQAATGLSRTFSTTTSGELYAWGQNSLGRLGLNNSSGNESSPVAVGALTNWLQVSTGDSNTVAVKTDGTLWAWGDNNNGQVGDNSVAQTSSPVQIGSLVDWTQASAGGDNAAAIGTTN